jgi:hypothetical protein
MPKLKFKVGDWVVASELGVSRRMRSLIAGRPGVITHISEPFFNLYAADVLWNGRTTVECYAFKFLELLEKR